MIKKRSRKIKYIDPPMKFNPGLQKFDVDLPKKGPLYGEHSSDKKILIVFLIIIGAILLLAFLIYLTSRIS